MIRFLINWLLCILGIERRYKLATVDDLPARLRKNYLYVVGDGEPWSAALLCPCGCGAVIQLSLLRNERPSWSVDLSKDGWPTISPSIWRTVDCRSHFFLRNGEIVWCNTDNLEGT